MKKKNLTLIICTLLLVTHNVIFSMITDSNMRNNFVRYARELGFNDPIKLLKSQSVPNADIFKLAMSSSKAAIADEFIKLRNLPQIQQIYTDLRENKVIEVADPVHNAAIQQLKRSCQKRGIDPDAALDDPNKARQMMQLAALNRQRLKAQRRSGRAQ